MPRVKLRLRYDFHYPIWVPMLFFNTSGLLLRIFLGVVVKI